MIPGPVRRGAAEVVTAEVLAAPVRGTAVPGHPLGPVVDVPPRPAPPPPPSFPDDDRPPAHLRRRVGRRAARFAWTIVDQAISALSNVAIGLCAARSLPSRQFGAFGVAFALSLFAVGVSRAVVSEPFVVVFSAVTGRPWRRALSAALSCALAVSLVLGLALVVGAVAVGPEIGPALLALAIALPGLLVQDALRFTFFAGLRPHRAVVCDLLWCAAEAVAVVALLRGGVDTAAPWLLAWGAGAYASAAVFLVWLRPRLGPGRAVAWCRERWQLAGPFVVEFLLANGAFQIVSLGVGAIAGLVAVASTRGAAVVLGPVFVAMCGLGYAAAPHAVGLVRGAPERLTRFLVLTSLGAGLLGVLGCAAVLLPGQLGSALLGATWPAAQPIFLPLGLAYGALGATLGPMVGLRALGAARSSLAVQFVAAPLSVAAGLAGASLAGASGAMWALFLARCVCLPLWWRQFRRARVAATTPPLPSTAAAAQWRCSAPTA